LFSVRAAGQRYRVIYRVVIIPKNDTDPADGSAGPLGEPGPQVPLLAQDSDVVAPREGVVTVLVLGIRKEGDKNDVYSIASKRLSL
jgi:hypothetical protein